MLLMFLLLTKSLGHAYVCAENKSQNSGLHRGVDCAIVKGYATYDLT